MRTRAAANSMAKGLASRRRHISTIASTSPEAGTKFGLAAAARSMNS
ncbi:MAG TPA: hypothetical protein VHF27_14390 [Acidimicrobiales bacterium]|nr:hypothetical protein [Acidimicrobiales bacterium]